MAGKSEKPLSQLFLTDWPFWACVGALSQRSLTVSGLGPLRSMDLTSLLRPLIVGPDETHLECTACLPLHLSNLNSLYSSW